MIGSATFEARKLAVNDSASKDTLEQLSRGVRPSKGYRSGNEAAGFAISFIKNWSLIMKTRSGGCTCGQVRYAVRGEPYRYGICHCADCRKESGSVFVVYAHWRRDDIDVTGEFKTYKGRSFCGICGSRLFDVHANDIELRVGSLDEAPTSLGPPEREAWTKRREPWLPSIVGAEQSFENPPGDISAQQDRS
jgi:hypothetical protein